MTGVAWSYLAVWGALAAVLLTAGGAGLVLAPLAVACGVHRSHLVGRLAGRGGRRRAGPSVLA